MTDFTDAAASRPGTFALAEARRIIAQKQAERHSIRVRYLRKVIIIGCAAGAGLLTIFTLFDPFRPTIGGLTIGQLGLNGTKVTMEQPKLNGFRKDGRAYEVRASSGVQDIREPNLIDLTDIDAKIAMADRSNTNITARSGTYDSKGEWMDMRGEVRIKSEAGYDVTMKSAHMDFKAGTMVSKEPVTVQMRSGMVAADQVNVTDNGQIMTFENNVKSIFFAEKDEPVSKAAPQQGSRP